MSGIEVSSLTVIQGSGVGRTAGGGWIPMQPIRSTARATLAYRTNERTGIRGNSVFIYRVVEQGKQVQYVVKSNSWQGGGLVFSVNGDATKASFTGRATLQRYENGVLDTLFPVETTASLLMFSMVI
jgi:hypothetical protein